MSNSLDSDAGGLLGLQSKRLNCVYLDSRGGLWLNLRNRMGTRSKSGLEPGTRIGDPSTDFADRIYVEYASARNKILLIRHCITSRVFKQVI